MSARSRFRTHDESLFARLMQERAIAGYILRPLPTLELRDRFLDTPDGALLEQGLLLRSRTFSGGARLCLRQIEPDAEVAQERYEQLPGGITVLPPGPVRHAVEERIGERELEVLLDLLQYRAPRALSEGERSALVISLDVVADQTDPKQPVISNEIEVELLGEGASDDLERLNVALAEAGFEPDHFTKFERGFFRRGLREEGRLLLLPRERSLLEGLIGSESAVERRRAEALLLAAQGEDDRTISRRVGLAPSRVRHWREAFRAERTHVFDEDVEPPFESADHVDLPTFTLSEIVSETSLLEQQAPPQTLEEALDRIAGHEASAGSGDGERADRDHDHTFDEPVLEEGHATSTDSPFDLPHQHETTNGPHRDTSPPEHDAEDVELTGAVEYASEQLPVEQEVPSPSLFIVDDATSERTSTADLIDPVELDAGASVAAAAATVIERAANEIHEVLSQSDLTGIPFPEKLCQSLRRARLGLRLGEGALSEQQLRRLVADCERLSAKAAEVEVQSGAAFAIEVDPDRALPASQLASALARTVWTVELRRELLGENGDGGLVRQVEQLRGRLSATADELYSAAGQRRLAHRLASTLWRRYEEVRQDLEPLLETSRLRISCLDLEQVLTCVAGDDARDAQRCVATLRKQLREHAILQGLVGQLGSFSAEWLEPGGVARPDALDDRRQAAEAEASEMLARIEASSRHLLADEFRLMLGRATATV